MKNAAVVILLLAACAVCALPGLGERDFWPPDEARYGEVTREMAEGNHHPLVPHLNGETYPDKPPGFFLAAWSVAEARGTGVDEWSCRLPSVIGGTILVLVAGLWTARAAGPAAGALAGLFLLASYLFAYEMRQAHLDMLNAAWTALALGCWFRAGSGGRPRRWCFAGFLFLALAVFTKGPMGLLALPVAALWALLTRRPRSFLNLGTLFGAVAFALLVGAWLLTAYRAEEARGEGLGRAWLDAALNLNVLQRATAGEDHVKPWWAYLARLPGNLLPFAPLALLFLLRPVRDAVMGPALPTLRFALLWLVVFLAVPSAVAGKREIYLLPLYPAAAILLALAADAAARAVPEAVRAWSGILAAALAVAAGTLVFAGGWGAERDVVLGFADAVSGGAASLRLAAAGVDPAEPDGWGGWLLGLGLILWSALFAPLAVAGLALSFVRAPRAAAGWTAAACAVAIGCGAAMILPEADPLISRRPLADLVASLDAANGSGREVGIFSHLDEGLPFYLRRPVPEIGPRDRGDPGDRDAARAALRAFLAKPGALAVVRDKDVARFGLKPGEDFAERGRRRVGSKDYLVVGAAR